MEIREQLIEKNIERVCFFKKDEKGYFMMPPGEEEKIKDKMAYAKTAEVLFIPLLGILEASYFEDIENEDEDKCVLVVYELDDEDNRKIVTVVDYEKSGLYNESTTHD